MEVFFFSKIQILYSIILKYSIIIQYYYSIIQYYYSIITVEYSIIIIQYYTDILQSTAGGAHENELWLLTETKINVARRR